MSLAGPTLAARRITVEILDEIDKQVQRYLLVMLVTNVLIAIAVWAALLALGLERAAMWGAIAGVLHVIPYVGSALTALAIGVAAFLQFGTLGAAAGAALVVFAIAVAPRHGLHVVAAGARAQLNHGRRIRRAAVLRLAVGRLGPAAGRAAAVDPQDHRRSWSRA